MTLEKEKLVFCKGRRADGFGAAQDRVSFLQFGIVRADTAVTSVDTQDAQTAGRL